jgi:hypothetical protein
MSKPHHGPATKATATPVASATGQGFQERAGHDNGHGNGNGNGTPSAESHGPGGHGGRGLHAAGDAFGFTITAGAVTAAEVTLPSGTVVSLPLTTGVSYSVDGTDVLATRSNTLSTEVTRYSDTDADGLYEVVASSRVMTSTPPVDTLGFSHVETVAVTLASGVVTDVTQTRWDGTSNVLLSATVVPADTTWVISNGLLVETHTQTDALAHYEIFQDGNADGVYTEVASGTGELVDLVGVLAQTASFASML